jgi:hypothetical protein
MFWKGERVSEDENELVNVEKLSNNVGNFGMWIFRTVKAELYANYDEV